VKRDAERRVAELRQHIARADYQYYVLDNPDLPDGEYDKLMIELRALEAQYPDLVTLTPRLNVCPVSPSLLLASSPTKCRCCRSTTRSLTRTCWRLTGVFTSASHPALMPISNMLRSPNSMGGRYGYLPRWKRCTHPEVPLYVVFLLGQVVEEFVPWSCHHRCT